MTQLTFRIDDDARIVRRGLQNLRTAIPKIGRSTVHDALRRIVRRMQEYPAPPSGSTYVRTFKLKRGWRIRAAGPTGWTVLNRATFRGVRYAKYVIGSAKGEKQAAIHKGRWKLFSEVANEEIRKLPKTIIRHMKRSGRPLRFT
jgi:hypothetical protein